MEPRNLLLLTLSLYLLNPIISRCGLGTLRCISPEDPTQARAVICDPTFNYVLYQHSCIQQIIPNCMLTIEPNKCKVCQFGNKFLK
jgi:hypothetical protein